MSKLSPSQVMILQTLAKNPEGLTRQQLEAKLPDASISYANLGPVFTEKVVPDEDFRQTLLGRGFVKVAKTPPIREGEKTWGAVWVITARGAKAALSTKTKIRAKTAIPPKLLDPIVIKFKATRTYGLERFTEADIKEIRTALGPEYAEVPLADLRQVIVNRRKTNAYSDPKQRRLRPVKAALAAFGPEGWLEPDFLTTAQVATLRQMIDPEAAEETEASGVA